MHYLRNRLLSASIISTALLTGCPAQDGATVKDLPTLVQTAARDGGIPGLAAAVISTDNIQSSVTGVRKSGFVIPIAGSDRFHLGSNIKAMTATLAAMLVESGVIQWSVTLADIFPEMSASMRAEYRNVTLEQLLVHRGGIVPLTEPNELARLPAMAADPLRARVQLTAWLLQQPSAATPGSTAKYSNGGYAIAAAMLERKTGQAYEILLSDLVLRPLSIVAHYEWPAAIDAAQPWGHEKINNRWVPNDPLASENQFPGALTPAGNISLSITDYARFVQSQLRGLRGAGGSLSATGYRYLHTPNGEFASGWIVRELAGVRTSAHDGSAGTYYALAVIQPERNRAVVVLSNAFSDAVANDANALALKLLELTR